MTVKSLRTYVTRIVRMPTNFYPLYDEGNDQVDRVSKVVPVGFQKIIPRYRLSTSDTRDLGTGPRLEEVAHTYFTSPAARNSTPEKAKGDQPSFIGNSIDLFA